MARAQVPAPQPQPAVVHAVAVQPLGGGGNYALGGGGVGGAVPAATVSRVMPVQGRPDYGLEVR